MDSLQIPRRRFLQAVTTMCGATLFSPLPWVKVGRQFSPKPLIWEPEIIEIAGGDSSNMKLLPKFDRTLLANEFSKVTGHELDPSCIFFFESITGGGLFHLNFYRGLTAKTYQLWVYSYDILELPERPVAMPLRLVAPQLMRK